MTRKEAAITFVVGSTFAYLIYSILSGQPWAVQVLDMFDSLKRVLF